MIKYMPTLHNLQKMDKFLETYDLSRKKKKNESWRNKNLNRLIMSQKIKSTIKNFWIKKHPGLKTSRAIQLY